MKIAFAIRLMIFILACGATFLAAPVMADPQAQHSHDSKAHRRHLEFLRKEAALEYQQRAYPLDGIPPGAMARALDQIRQASPNGLPPGPLTPNLWYNLGPAPMNSTQNLVSQQVSGRVSAVAVDPYNQDHWLIGGAQGGVWETTNSGGTWAPRTDSQASLAMGAIAFAPGTQSLVFAGTGEPNFSGDSYAGGGLLASHDGGTTWQMLNNSFAQTSISGIEVDAFNTNNISVTTARGIEGIVTGGSSHIPTAPPRGVFVSSNGGTNFTRVLTGEATALVAASDNFVRQYAALGEIFGDPTNGVYRTTNGWTTSSFINGPWTTLASPTNIGRISMAISPVTTGTLYVGVSFEADTGGLVGVWRTDNAWDPTPTWTNLPNPSVDSILWYAFGMSVDPTDFTTLYLTEETAWKFSGGAWTDIGESIHADNHVMAWVSQGFGFYRMLLGNDGGIWESSTPVTSSWTDLNTSGLSISQMYKGSVHPKANNALALAGTQDNGTAANLGTLGWKHVLTGDGADNAISSSNPDMNWAASWETFEGFLNIYRSQDAGTNWTGETAGIDMTDAPFFVHFEKSPRIDDLFIAGTIQLWRCTNFFSGTDADWSSNSPVMVGVDGQPVVISAMAFAPSDSNGLIYAFGTVDGQLRMTTNAGTTWNDMDPLNEVPGRYVTGLGFNPGNPDLLYVTLSGFDEGTPGQPGHVFETTNARAATPSWINVSPPVDLPMDCVVIDPNNGSSIFVGSDIGVWSSSNAGLSWTHLGPSVGMPNVAVFDLRMNSVSQLTAFTHGRGAFFYGPGIPLVVVDGPVRPVDIACSECPPLRWINPGDLVTIEFPLLNMLPVNTVNLTATMLASAQVTPVNGTQSYGVLQGQGAGVSRSFSFMAQETAGGPGPAGGSCGGTVDVTLQLSDQGTNLGQVKIPFQLGVPSYPLSEVFDENPTPSLPPNWSTSASGAEVPWVTTSNAPPNAIPSDAPDDSNVDDAPDLVYPPNVCAFTPAITGIGQSILFTAPFTVASSQAQLYFRQASIVSNAFDGCILEISSGVGQPFQDILAAGGSFAQNGYNFTLKDNNPLGPRSGWSGNSGGWQPVLVNLPAAAAGQSVQLRWRFATSRGMTNGGWYIDSVAVTDPQCLSPVTNPVIVNSGQTNSVFSFGINTVSGRTYVVEYKTNLNDSAWTFFENLNGNGSLQTVHVPVTSARQQFYRFHVQ